MVRLEFHQKFGIAAFLFLSIFMIIVALIRLFGAMRPSLRSNRDFDTAWEIFWQHMEGCVAVLIGSITAFRNIFGAQLTEEQGNRSQRITYFARFWSWLGVCSSTKKKQANSIICRRKHKSSGSQGFDHAPHNEGSQDLYSKIPTRAR
jgi:hypothetical protein